MTSKISHTWGSWFLDKIWYGSYKHFQRKQNIIIITIIVIIIIGMIIRTICICFWQICYIFEDILRALVDLLRVLTDLPDVLAYLWHVGSFTTNRFQFYCIYSSKSRILNWYWEKIGRLEDKTRHILHYHWMNEISRLHNK